MNGDGRVLQAVLIKVKPGKESEVRKWLRRKTASDPKSRRCESAVGAAGECPIMASDRMDAAEKEVGIARGWPCEKMRVLASAYMTGPFDFLLVAVVPDCSTQEQFLVNCLRGGELRDHITDTQTLSGLTHYCCRIDVEEDQKEESQTAVGDQPILEATEQE